MFELYSNELYNMRKWQHAARSACARAARPSVLLTATGTSTTLHTAARSRSNCPLTAAALLVGR